MARAPTSPCRSASAPSTIGANHRGKDMDARRFEGKVALVTGGNSGIGLAVARGLVDEGARVVIVGRNKETVGRSAGELGKSARGIVADTSRLADLDRVIAATREFGGGRLDVVFANAGVGTFGPLAATMKMCEQDVSTQEQGYLAALDATASFTIDGDQLSLSDDAGQVLLQFSGKAIR